jgi:hypothetical protein
VPVRENELRIIELKRLLADSNAGRDVTPRAIWEARDGVWPVRQLEDR